MSVAAPVLTGWMSRLESLGLGEVRAGEPLAPKTSMRVGGAAEVFVRPSTVDALLKLMVLVKDAQIPLHVLGGGANTLVADAGIAGVVLKLPPQLFPEEVQRGAEATRITLGGGAAIARLIQQMKAHHLVGAEFLAGIPGTLGGAVTMNAGTKMGECMSVVEAVEVATADGLRWIPREQIPVTYRHTELPAGAVMTRVRFLLRPGDEAESQRKMEEDLAYRKRTQPLSMPNSGSVFQNPPGGHAGKLIEDVGLKGHTVGGAQISTLHANWIVNLGNAAANDVLSLIQLMQARVKDTTGIELKPEVKRVGSFSHD